MQAPTGSMSNIVLKDKILRKDGGVDKKNEKFVFNKRGKLKSDEITELKRTHKSLDAWFRSGGESVMARVSHIEEPNHHGGEHTPLLGPATITEKGVGLGQVVGWRTTGDQTVHTPVLGAEGDADLRKVEILPASTYTGVALTVTGADEDFSTDIETLKLNWDILENDEKEWKVEEGRRRNGRRISRRISDLIDKFEGGGEAEHSNPLDGGNSVKFQNLNTISHTKGRGADSSKDVQKINVVRSKNLSSDSMTSERRDWPIVTNIQLSPTNGSQARSQVADRNSNNGSAVQMNIFRR